MAEGFGRVRAVGAGLAFPLNPMPLRTRPAVPDMLRRAPQAEKGPSRIRGTYHQHAVSDYHANGHIAFRKGGVGNPALTKCTEDMLDNSLVRMKGSTAVTT